MCFELKFFECRHVSIWGFQNTVCPYPECPYPEKINRPSFVNISTTLVINASMERYSRVLQHLNPKIWIYFKKVCNCILSVTRLSVPREKKSPWFRQYQSYISNWYVNEKVFTSTTAWKPKNLNFFSKKVKIEFWLIICLMPKCWNHLSFNVSPTLVIGTSQERFSRVLQHGNSKNWLSF